MNCYNHRDKPAVGLCKSCGRAVCGDCIAEVDRSIACKGECEDRVRRMNHMLAKNPQIMKAYRGQLRGNGLVAVAVGIGCVVFAIWAHFETPGYLPYFLGLVAIACLAIGFVRLSRRYRYPALNGESDSNNEIQPTK